MSEVKVDTISERTAAGGVTIDGVLIKDGVATFQTAAGSPLVFEGATADAFETTFAITDPTADRTITFPDADITLAAGDTNTPAWHVGINSSTQSISDDTVTKVELDDVKFDTGFTWDTTNFRGIPGTVGKYLIGCFAGLDTSSTSLVNAFVYLYKNGASQAWWELDLSGNVFDNGGLGGTTILDLGATDYVEMFVYFDFNSTSATLRQIDSTQCVTYMFGTKLIGA
jgi:hypothetical protein